jgi:beta-lactamase superfamily II metal-dependent hydrolase
MKKLILLLTLIFSVKALYAQQVGLPLPDWKEGEMEIHHIFTGRGEGVFCIFPDGTTMLIDAGDSGPWRDPRTTKAVPDDSRQAGEWMARYISNRIRFKNDNFIDYAFLTHFHGDHMGGVYENSPKTRKGGDYVLSGITEVGEYLRFNKMIDRDWPAYQYPQPLSGRTFENYQSFVRWKTQNENMQMERFVPGSNAQFVLVHNPDKFKGQFEIRNIVANGEVWTGKGNKTKSFFPKGAQVSENMCSAGVRISYGNFDYFNGGDLIGRIALNEPEWQDIERHVGKVLGPVEVCEANHHAWVDAMSDHFISSVQPQVIVMQVWNASHINFTTLRTMTSKSLNPSIRHIVPTTIHDLSKAYIGEQNLGRHINDGILVDNTGHVVIKVEPGGDKYHIYIVDVENNIVKLKLGPLESR